MGIVFSSWDNTELKEDFELDFGQTTADKCTDATNIIKNFTVHTWGSTEDYVEPVEEGFLNFPIYQDGYNHNKFLSTKSWSTASVSDREVTISGNNSLFLRND